MAPAEVTIGRPTKIAVTGAAGAEPLRVLLSPLPGGGNCCGVAVGAGTRRDGPRAELRFTWPRTYLRCAGMVVRCGRVTWGRRGRITVVSEPGRAIATRDVTIRRARSLRVGPAARGRRDAGEPLGRRAS